MKIAFKTFGCRANSVDTDMLYMEALKQGHDLVEDTEVAEAYIINSCTVTENADKDTRSQVRRFRKLNPKAIIGVIGCYSQVAPEEVKTQEGVDFVIGTADKQRIFEFLESKNSNLPPISPATGFLPKNFWGSRKSRASIKIQDGCNYHCSFCIIPEARGRSRSLNIEDVLKQIRQAQALGFEEVVLTGIHLAHYGWDKNCDLDQLLKTIFSEPGPRIRLSTLDPFEIPESLLEWLAKEPRLCSYFHIALQSGDNEILKKMRRLYKAEEFVDITKKIKAIRPETFIGVDVIVGFPGETETHFQNTIRCLDISSWTKLHVFSYSERKNTGAINLEGKVSPFEIQKRSKILRKLSQKRYLDFLESQLGSTREVIIEKNFSTFLWEGHTDNYIPILLHAPQAQPKQKQTVFLDKIQGQKVWGRM